MGPRGSAEVAEQCRPGTLWQCPQDKGCAGSGESSAAHLAPNFSSLGCFLHHLKMTGSHLQGGNLDHVALCNDCG